MTRCQFRYFSESRLCATWIRSGFTIIELLVSIAVVGILIALLIPAVQSAREASRAAACKSNLRQIGLALHNYHDVHQSFPPGNIMMGTWDSGDYNFVNWSVGLLPFLEQQQIWNDYDQSSPNESTVNALVLERPLPVFQCPSDFNSGSIAKPESGGGRDNKYATGSYRGVAGRSDGQSRPNGGSWFDGPNSLPATWRGVLHHVGTGSWRTERAASIGDGLSNTLAVGEYYSKPCPTFVMGSTGTCRRTTFWGYSYTSYSLSSVCSECGTRTFLSDYDECVRQRKSHSGGEDVCKRSWGNMHSSLHFLMCDGSVRNIAKSVNLEVLARAATISGAEVLGDL